MEVSPLPRSLLVLSIFICLFSPHGLGWVNAPSASALGTDGPQRATQRAHDKHLEGREVEPCSKLSAEVPAEKLLCYTCDKRNSPTPDQVAASVEPMLTENLS